MDWIKWTKAVAKALLLFGIIILLCWFFQCVLAKDELDWLGVVISYMLAETTIRYYENEK